MVFKIYDYKNKTSRIIKGDDINYYYCHYSGEYIKIGNLCVDDLSERIIQGVDVVQSINRKDVNGNLIFDGDIVHIKQELFDMKVDDLFVVENDGFNTRFRKFNSDKYLRSLWFIDKSFIEIKGNIYENEELKCKN